MKRNRILTSCTYIIAALATLAMALTLLGPANAYAQGDIPVLQPQPRLQPAGESPAIDPVNIAVAVTNSGVTFFPEDQVLVRVPNNLTQQQAATEIFNAASANLLLVGFYPAINGYLVKFPGIANLSSTTAKNNELERIIQALRNRFGATRVLRNYLAWKSGSSDYDDLSSSRKKPFDTVRIPTMWDYMSKARRFDHISLAIVDSGVRREHNEFGDTGNMQGKSYVEDKGSTLRWYNDHSTDGHGTGIASVIAARDNNGGLTGVLAGTTSNYNLLIYKTHVFNKSVAASHAPADVVKYLNSFNPSLVSVYNDFKKETSSPLSSVLDAIRLASDNGARIINLSIEWSHESVIDKDELKAISEIFKSYMNYYNQMLFISAAGNGLGKELPVADRIGYQLLANEHAPGGVVAANHITVGASNGSGTSRATFSNHGSRVDVYAPGASVYAAGNASNSKHLTQDGTSFAAPMVAGVAASLWALDKNMSAGAVKNYIVNNATTSGSMKLLNAAESAKRVLIERQGVSFVTTPPPSSGGSSGSSSGGSSSGGSSSGGSSSGGSSSGGTSGGFSDSSTNFLTCFPCWILIIIISLISWVVSLF